MNAICPACGMTQTQTPSKKWCFSHSDVSRYECKCGQKFNCFERNGRVWTIPKRKK